MPSKPGLFGPQHVVWPLTLSSLWAQAVQGAGWWAMVSQISVRRLLLLSG